MPAVQMHPELDNDTLEKLDQLDDVLNSRDASWILTSAVIIFTMQTGKSGYQLQLLLLLLLPLLLLLLLLVVVTKTAITIVMATVVIMA